MAPLILCSFPWLCFFTWFVSFLFPFPGFVSLPYFTLSLWSEIHCILVMRYPFITSKLEHLSCALDKTCCPALSKHVLSSGTVENKFECLNIENAYVMRAVSYIAVVEFCFQLLMGLAYSICYHMVVIEGNYLPAWHVPGNELRTVAVRRDQTLAWLFKRGEVEQHRCAATPHTREGPLEWSLWGRTLTDRPTNPHKEGWKFFVWNINVCYYLVSGHWRQILSFPWTECFIGETLWTLWNSETGLTDTCWTSVVLDGQFFW